jgi:hypothetical protein
MSKPNDMLLVSAPNARGEAFIRMLCKKSVPFAAIVNNKSEYERMTELGVERIIAVNTSEEDTWIMPDFRIGKVVLFERSVNLCCRYIQICRGWTTKLICVVTDSHKPRHVYKGLGADCVIHAGCGGDGSLLAEDLLLQA